MIREMEKNDITAVMDVWLTSTIKAHPFLSENYWTKNYRTVKNKYLSVAKTYVNEVDGVIVGFISIIKDGFIGALFVLPGCQGHRVGEQLLKFVQQAYPQLHAHAYERNPRALHFYKKHGFIVSGKQPNLDSSFIEFILEWKK